LDAAFAGRCAELDDTLIWKGTSRNLAITSFVVAGLAAGGAAAVYALWPRSAAGGERTVRVSPFVGAKSGGAVIGGAF
jgi:hypothetical protein